MSPGALVISLARERLQIRLGTDGQMRRRAPDGVMTDEILDRLRQQREGIRSWLEGRCRECLIGLYHDDSIAAGVCRSCRSRLVRAVGEWSVT